MSKKEKVLKISYEVLGQMIGGIIFVFVFLGIGYLTDIIQYLRKEEFVIGVSLWLLIGVSIFTTVRIFLEQGENSGEELLRIILIHITCYFSVNLFFSCDGEAARNTLLLLVISWGIRKWIEFVAKKGKYDISCIGYRDVLVRKKEVMVYPLYSKFIWKNFLSHLEECPEEKKKIMLQEIKTFANRIYKLNTEDLELLGIVDDKRSYVKQVEIYYDSKKQKLVKYYRYDYENYENMGRLEKFLLRLNKKYNKIRKKL